MDSNTFYRVPEGDIRQSSIVFSTYEIGKFRLPSVLAGRTGEVKGGNDCAPLRSFVRTDISRE